MGDDAISVQKYDIYEVKNCGKGVTRELRILCMNWYKTYRLYSYPAWRDILRGRWDKLSASKSAPASSVHFRRLWDTRNLRRTSPSLKHSKEYRASRPTAGEKFEACLYTGRKVYNTSMVLSTWADLSKKVKFDTTYFYVTNTKPT